MSKWEPYFRPTTKKHDSGFRCFECGYLVMGDDRKAAKKVIIARGVDHISNWLFSPLGEGAQFDMDLLCDGNIRIFNHKQPIFWSIPGFSDATIIPNKVEAFWQEYDELDEIWEKQNQKGGEE